MIWLRAYSRLIVGATALCGVVALSYLFLLTPLMERSQALKSEMASLESRLNIVSDQTAAAAADMLALSRSLDDRPDPAEEGSPRMEDVPARGEVAAIARRFRELARASDLRVEMVDVSPEQLFFDESGPGGKEDFRLTQLELRFTGTYRQIGCFLGGLAAAPIPHRILWLEADRGEREGIIKARVSIGIPLGPPAPTSGRSWSAVRAGLG